jgi:hypothetical protein
MDNVPTLLLWRLRILYIRDELVSFGRIRNRNGKKLIKGIL